MSEGVFLFREARPEDADSILELARHLDTLNLPPERDFVADLLSRSIASFSGGDRPDRFDPARRFLFVLESPAGDVVGTSMIHAQHGTPEEPHVFFRVLEEERYAHLQLEGEERHVHMCHKMLHLGRTYAGPSEIGGLVLDPALRRHPQRLGRLLSLARFIYIAAQRDYFRERVLAELLPPLYRGPQGRTRSPLWDALGSRFTNMGYAEADALSRENKEFIWMLFPLMPVHASLLPEGVQDIIGEVGPATIGAQRLLQSIGFKDSGNVDPFDGGPHYEANTDEVTLVRDARRFRPLVDPDPKAPGDVLPGIVGAQFDTAPHFRAVYTSVRAVGDHESEEVALPAEALERLGLMNEGQPTPDARVILALRPKRRRADRLPQSAASDQSG